MIQLATPPADFGTDRIDLTPPSSETRATEEAADDEAGCAGSAPHPMEADEVDELEALGDQIATLAAHLHAATHQLLVLIAEFDERRGWEADGHRSCAHWLAFRTGIEMVTAREKVRVARALRNLPQISTAMSNGAISFAKARALTRSASAENEGELLGFARDTTAAQLERTLRSMKLLSRNDEVELERERHRWRSFSVFPDGTGMYEVRGRLDPEVAAVLMRAIEAASDALYSSTTGAKEVEPAQRRADALGLVAERALGAGSVKRRRPRPTTLSHPKTLPRKRLIRPQPATGAGCRTLPRKCMTFR